MEVIAICVTVLLTLTGYIINEQAARRSKRRDIRTQYLLSAYRRIEAASNRSLDNTAARDLEAALADVQLLGSVSQINSAHSFADSFANNGEADTGSLLNELRKDLRADLDLGPLPERRTHLRISVGSPIPEILWLDNARISAEAIAAQQRVVAFTSKKDHTDRPRNSFAIEGSHSILWSSVQNAVRHLLEHEGESIVGLSFNERLDLALERGLVSQQVWKSISGLEVMHDLLVSEISRGESVDEKAQEFTVLATAIRGLFDAGLAGPVRGDR